MENLVWVEISKEALEANIKTFRSLVGENTILCPCVKANAYGHGLIETSKIFLESGANWLAVNSLYEAKALREAGVTAPIYVLGYIALSDLEEVLNLDLRIVVYNKETVGRLGEIAEKSGKKAKIHIKIETGNNRQGVVAEEIRDFVKYILSFKNLEIEGLSTHFANIEDTKDHSYAEIQLKKFNEIAEMVEDLGVKVPFKHSANSAATLLFPETHFEMVRPGIATYGMWPSDETFLSFSSERKMDISLSPALCWKTKIAQIKTVPSGELIGYGCTYKTTRETKIAILPVGYYDGYDRGINNAHVLIHGKRAALRGRVCMNIIMADVTDIPEASLEDEVVLLGRDGDETISAEQFAKWAGTINYEITTRINDRIPRIYV
ncbi:MAG: alanine racemase [Candidatus Peregrinibacteria bacterium]|nr:alanine racemase [Candidatus Peregrinibacteria bacterium]